jgi:hypothetical protein
MYGDRSGWLSQYDDETTLQELSFFFSGRGQEILIFFLIFFPQFFFQSFISKRIKRGGGVKPLIHLYPMSRCRMRVAMPPMPHTPSCLNAVTNHSTNLPIELFVFLILYLMQYIYR